MTTADVEFHSAADDEPVRRDVNRPSSTPRSAVHCNDGYIYDDDEIVEEPLSDRSGAQRERFGLTRPASGNDLGGMASPPPTYDSWVASDPYRRSPNPARRDPVSNISGHLGGSAQVDYNRTSTDVYAANLHRHLNDASI